MTKQEVVTDASWDCTAGQDCSGTNTVWWKACEPGQYNSDPAVACADVEEDYYIGDILGNTPVLCSSGYKCTGAATVAQPAVIYVDDTSTPNYICRLGQYCDNEPGKTVPQVENACPSGTYMPHYGATGVDDCIPCPEGFVCEADGSDFGVVTPVACSANTYCLYETSTATCTGSVGEVCQSQCSLGYHCPMETITNTVVTRDSDGLTVDVTETIDYGARALYSCGYGKRQENAGMDSCDICADGELCELRIQSTASTCDAGYYCSREVLVEDPSVEIGAAVMYHCPAGRKTASANSGSVDDCIPPTDVSTYYKHSGPTGFGTIANGYATADLSAYDTAGEWDEIPVSKGSVCTYGDYCQAGISYTCPAGYFCEEGKMDFDPSNSVDAGDVTLYQCDYGYYCGGQSRSRRPRAQSSDDSTTMNDICPAGEYCIKGSDQGTQCPAGTYSTGLGLREEGDCPLCPPGYDCTVANDL